jgi:hypothetical protein
LCEVTIDLILNDGNSSTFYSLDACPAVICYRLIFLYFGVVLFASAYDSVVFILFDDIELDSGIASNLVLSDGYNAILKTLLDSVHNDKRVS